MADGTAMVRQSAGVYTYPVTDPAVGLVYQWYAEYTAGGTTRRDPFTTLGTAAATAEGFWWTQVKVQNRWGPINTTVAAALDGVEGGASVTIQSVGDDVDVDIDRALRVRGYSRPDPDTSDDYAVVSRMAVDVLHWRLEGRRGGGKTAGAREDAREQEQAIWDALDDILQGPTAYASEGIDFPAISDTPVVTAPAAIYPTVDRDGRTVTAGNLGWGLRWDVALGQWRNW